MRKLTVLLALIIALGQWGCQFVAGTGSGNITSVSGNDPNSSYQMNQLGEDYRDQNLTRTDDESRKRRVAITFSNY